MLSNINETIVVFVFVLSCFLVFCPFKGHPHSIWRSPGYESNRSCSCQLTPEPQQRQIQATCATYTTAHGNTGSLTHWGRPGIEPTTSCFLVRSVSTVPLQELQWNHSFEVPYIFSNAHWHMYLTIKKKKKDSSGSSLVAQQTNDPMLLMLWLGSLLWLGYDDQPKNFHMSWAQTKKKERFRFICVPLQPFLMCYLPNTALRYLPITPSTLLKSIWISKSLKPSWQLNQY